MIDKLLNTISTRNCRSLSEAKTKIASVAKQDPRQLVQQKIPNPSDLKNQLESIDKNDLQSLQRAQRAYNKSVNTIQVIINKLEARKAQLFSIKTKLDSILLNLTIVEEIIQFINPLLGLIQGIVNGIDGALGASSSLAANGLVINKLGEKKKDLKDNIKKARNGINDFSRTSTDFKTKVNELMEPLNKGIEFLDKIINKLKELLNKLKEIWTQFGLELIIAELLEAIENSGQTPEDWWDENNNDGIPGSNEPDTGSGVGNENNPSIEEKNIAFKKFKV